MKMNNEPTQPGFKSPKQLVCDLCKSEVTKDANQRNTCNHEGLGLESFQDRYNEILKDNFQITLGWFIYISFNYFHNRIKFLLKIKLKNTPVHWKEKFLAPKKHLPTITIEFGQRLKRPYKKELMP
jgi:hypothetical protein